MTVYVVLRPFDSDIAGVFEREKDARDCADKINADMADKLSLPKTVLPEVAIAIVEAHEVRPASQKA